MIVLELNLEEMEWIVILVFLLARIQAQSFFAIAVNSNHVDYYNVMVSVKDTEQGVKVTLVPMTGVQGPATFNTKVIPDRRLSPDCGHQYFRCQKSLVLIPPPITSNPQGSLETLHILLVPLQNGLLLLELHFLQSSLMQFGSYKVLTNSQCSPSAVFRIYDSFYSMCTDLENLYISLYEVRLNGTQIQEAQLFGPLVSLSNDDLGGFTSSDVMNTSNFLLYTDIPHQPLIYFAIDSYLFTIAPLDWSFYDEFDPIGARCRQIHNLVNAPNSQLLTYCSKEYVYYDVDYQDWLSEHTYENSGMPHLCPNQNYGVVVHNDYLEYRIGSNTGSFSNVYFDNGLCLNGSKSNIVNFFVYIDKRTDSVRYIAFNRSSSLTDLVQSFRVGCSSAIVDCIPLLSINDRYLVIQQAQGDGVILVLDADDDFRRVVNVSHLTPSLVTILTLSLKFNGNEDKAQSSGYPPGLIVLGVMLSLMFFISVAVLLLIVVVLLRIKHVTLCHRGKKLLILVLMLP